ncbi:hypothetical protein WwSim0204 [Wolbachia endosymbiont of Drosophila simulans]|nr:hypothetical protein WwSim0204 [Wolbachia endosymbiont of Drosophila simulans]
MFAASFSLSEAKNTLSPGSMFVASLMWFSLFSSRNLAIGPFAVPSLSNVIYPRPLAPNSFCACSIFLSKKLRGSSAVLGAGMALTTIPRSILLLKILNPESRKISVTSLINSGLRRSGLSEPYLSIASLYVIRGKSLSTDLRENLANTLYKVDSII